MTEHRIKHATVSLTRELAAAPATVFDAWSNKEALLEWSAPGAGWFLDYERFDFRVGHTDLCRFGMTGQSAFVNSNTYLEIVPNRRMISASTLAQDGKIAFAGLLTVEISASGGGSRLVLTEMGAYIDGVDDSAGHRAGWREMLDKLDAYLQRVVVEGEVS